MKRILLFIVGLTFGLTAIAQQDFRQLDNPRALESVKLTLDREVQDPRVEVLDFSMPANLTQVATLKSGRNIEEAHIITTEYDLQTNASLSNRVIAWPDGSAAAASTMGFEPISANRGSGYNYYDGTAWEGIPAQRVESEYAGWPSITHWGENGEALFSHTLISNVFYIVMYVRETKGEGDWVEHFTFPNPSGRELTWPRVISSGENNQYMHIIAAEQDDNLDSHLFFSRSTDGGDTWAEWSDVPEYSAADYGYDFSADSYTAASFGNTVAFLFLSKWSDMFYIKSDDNGETWEKHVIWEHPIEDLWANWEEITFDTTYMTGGSGSLAIDSDGNVHAVWSLMRYMKDEPGDGYSYFPFVNGIAYWNETMGALPEHPNGPLYTLEPQFMFDNGMVAGWTPDLDGDGTVTFEQYPAASDVVDYRADGMASWPAISIDPETNSIAIFFSTVDEERWNDIFYYRSIFASYKDGIYGTWYYNKDHLMDNFIHLFDEGIYPTTAAKAFNNEYFLAYQADPTQGTHWGPVDPDHAVQENYVYGVKVSGYWVGLNEVINPISHVSSAYPNPVTGEAFNIDINLSQRANKAQVSIHNIAGQLVYHKDLGNLNTGMNKVQLEVTNFQSGVYFYTVTVDDYKETKKVIVR